MRVRVIFCGFSFDAFLLGDSCMNCMYLVLWCIETYQESYSIFHTSNINTNICIFFGLCFTV